jgi:hypothetical protein
MTFTPPTTFKALADTLLGETPPENEYRYAPLRSNNNEIRILILHKGKGKEKIRWELVRSTEAPLEDGKLLYEAVSYCWDTGNATH